MRATSAGVNRGPCRLSCSVPKRCLAQGKGASFFEGAAQTAGKTRCARISLFVVVLRREMNQVFQAKFYVQWVALRAIHRIGDGQHCEVDTVIFGSRLLGVAG